LATAAGHFLRRKRQMAKDKQKLGILGEFLAAAKLTELGFIAAPTLKNTAKVDTTSDCHLIKVTVTRFSAAFSPSIADDMMPPA
jgi:hypothetical protein